MILLTFGVAIFDVHTRLARLEADAPLSAAVCTAEGRRRHRLLRENFIVRSRLLRSEIVVVRFFVDHEVRCLHPTALDAGSCSARIQLRAALFLKTSGGIVINNTSLDLNRGARE